MRAAAAATQKDAEAAEATQESQSTSDMENDFTRDIIGAAVEVQRVLGTGLLESAYRAALALEFSERGLRFQQDAPIAGEYKGRALGVVYQADFLVEQSVVLQIKAVETVNEFHRAQLLSYLRVGQFKLGLVINFHVFPLATKGVHRVMNRL
jgi:GxxExxY protein